MMKFALLILTILSPLTSIAQTNDFELDVNIDSKIQYSIEEDQLVFQNGEGKSNILWKENKGENKLINWKPSAFLPMRIEFKEDRVSLDGEELEVKSKNRLSQFSVEKDEIKAYVASRFLEHSSSIISRKYPNENIEEARIRADIKKVKFDCKKKNQSYECKYKAKLSINYLI